MNKDNITAKIKKALRSLYRFSKFKSFSSEHNSMLFIENYILEEALLNLNEHDIKIVSDVWTNYYNQEEIEECIFAESVENGFKEHINNLH